MSEFLSALFPWTKALHVIAVIAWMAGLFYLPRLFVYHVEVVERGSATARMFEIMELRLLRVIMNPAMIAVWIFGLSMVLTPGIVDWSEGWPWVKAAAVIAMTWFHHWLGLRRKELAAGNCQVTGRRFRLMNEVPAVLVIVIVIAVIVRPF